MVKWYEILNKDISQSYVEGLKKLGYNIRLFPVKTRGIHRKHLARAEISFNDNLAKLIPAEIERRKLQKKAQEQKVFGLLW